MFNDDHDFHHNGLKLQEQEDLKVNIPYFLCVRSAEIIIKST